MKSYDSGGPMVSGHTTPQGGDRDKHGEDPQYHPAKPSGRVFAEWVRLPKVASMPEVTFMVEQSAPSATAAPGRWFLETFLKALDTHNGHGTPSLDRAEAYLLKAEARKLLASAQTEIDSTAALRRLSEDVLRCIDAGWKPGVARDYSNLGPILAEYIDDLRKHRAEADADQAKDAARYRWLRNPTRPVAIYIDGKLPFAVDSAIDAELDGPHGE